MTTDVTLHHVHLVTADVPRLCEFLEKNFDAEIVFDDTIDGDRNIFLRIGTGRIHLFESRRPPQRQRNIFHHIGMMAGNLEKLVATLTASGVEVTDITRTPGGGFAMVTGPDGLLIELFEVTDPESRKAFVDVT
ncbi:VOC family protein [Saccharomonospora sp. NPDC046836]|uniref:VOC family protein n=1 Tax=Saccharomonospora sp. NPDC046836 TaxID=3156921 RepID=UPI0033F6617D